MSLMPERISIKRRRQEEPVDTLYLEHGTGPDKKRRVTDFYFQRLRDHVIAPISQRLLPPSQPRSTDPAIPTVRSTAPGDAKRDFEKAKAALKASTENKEVAASTVAQINRSAPTTPDESQATRRFHLARHLSGALRPSPSSASGIRKPKSLIRPPLATFVERHRAPFSHEENPLYETAPIDKLVDVPANSTSEGAGGGPAQEQQPTLETFRTSQRHLTATFLQTGNNNVRRGTSIHDHPNSWNLESDQLADELAALAMELDPTLQERAETEHPPASQSPPKDVVMTSSDRDDEFVYETYIRVRHDGESPSSDPNVGVLVIEEEDEDLWQKYIESDDDTDWDDEDSNAEDNPSNDYPEDEVSSDDEYGFNTYKYRTYGSDHENFDADNPNDDDKW